MDFLEKLINDTKEGKLDYVWHYNSSKTYTYKKAKDPLTGLSIDATQQSNTIIFPNGFAVAFNQNDLNILLEEIGKSLERTAKDMMNGYLEDIE